MKNNFTIVYQFIAFSCGVSPPICNDLEETNMTDDGICFFFIQFSCRKTIEVISFFSVDI